MRPWILLLLLAWLPPALAHHHHGITLDPAARVATPHLASSGDTQTATPAHQSAKFAPTEASTTNAQNQTGIAPVGLLLLLLLGGWGLRQLVKRSGKTVRVRRKSNKPPVTH